MKGNITCGCYWNGIGFYVGRKYLWKCDVESDKKLNKILLTDSVRERLDEIDDEYSYDDVNRTIAVLDLINER